MVTVADGRFVLSNAAGGRLADASLVGTILVVQATPELVLELRVDGVRNDAAAVGSALTVYEVAVREDDGTWRRACPANAKGLAEAVPLRGYWDTQGDHHDIDGTFTLACTATALGKCVRMGYRPWQTAPDGRSFRKLHQACTRMLRADYCGDGRSWTKDGTIINVFDGYGIQVQDPRSDLAFEAAWAADGAVCVAKPRLPQRHDVAMIEAACPARLRHRTGAECTLARASRAADVLFNESSAR
ncbi:MAG: ADYC domain-containing protein [Pseudomonadota bacterium]